MRIHLQFYYEQLAPYWDMFPGKIRFLFSDLLKVFSSLLHWLPAKARTHRQDGWRPTVSDVFCTRLFSAWTIDYEGFCSIKLHQVRYTLSSCPGIIFCLWQGHFTKLHFIWSFQLPAPTQLDFIRLFFHTDFPPIRKRTRHFPSFWLLLKQFSTEAGPCEKSCS